MTTVVEDGWTALEQARWREAREAFTRALAAEDTAAAHEGLSCVVSEHTVHRHVTSILRNLDLPSRAAAAAVAARVCL